MPQDVQIVYIGLLFLVFLLTAILYLAIIMRRDGLGGEKSFMTGNKLLFEGTPTNNNVPTDYRGLHLSEDVCAALKAWAAKQSDKPSLSDAIERLIEIGVSD
jgi:hypothetical protein